MRNALASAMSWLTPSGLSDLRELVSCDSHDAERHIEIETRQLPRGRCACDNDRERVEFLFALYERLSALLTVGLDVPKSRRKRTSDE